MPIQKIPASMIDTDYYTPTVYTSLPSSANAGDMAVHNNVLYQWSGFKWQPFKSTQKVIDILPKKNLQILHDFDDPACYTPGATQSFNVVPGRTGVNVGYHKITSNATVNGTRYVSTTGQNTAINDVGSRISIDTSAAGVDRFSETHSFTILTWQRYLGTNDVSAAGGSPSRMFSTGSAGSGTSDNCIWQMWFDRDQFYWWNINGGNSAIANSYPRARGSFDRGFFPDTNQWFMNAVVWDGSRDPRTLEIYQNTFKPNVYTYTTTAISAAGGIRDRSTETTIQWTLGGGYYSSCYTANSASHHGIFALWNRCLSPEEIRMIYINTRHKYKI